MHIVFTSKAKIIPDHTPIAYPAALLTRRVTVDQWSAPHSHLASPSTSPRPSMTCTDTINTWVSGLPILPTEPPDSPTSSPPISPSHSPSPNTTSQFLKRKRDLISSDPVVPPNERPSQTQKLTRKNLATISDSMTGEQEPSTPSRKTPSTKPVAKLPRNLQTVRDALIDHGMQFDVREAYEERCPSLKEKVDEIFAKDRASRMGKDSQDGARKSIVDNYGKNEKTIFGEVVPKVITHTHTVPSNKRDMHGEAVYIAKSYGDDMLERTQQSNFVKYLVPGKNYSSSEKSMGLTDPIPDWTYGVCLDRSRIPGQQPSDAVKALIGVSPGMRHPFLVIECKSAEDGIGLAENQAMRDGSVLVNARMKLNDILKKPNFVYPVGADLDSFAFSCAWNPDQAKIFVHWFEKTADGSELFHMTFIRDYSMSRKEEIADHRRDIHNIMDWGLYINKPAAEEVVKKIVAQAKLKGKEGSTQSSSSTTIEGNA